MRDFVLENADSLVQQNDCKKLHKLFQRRCSDMFSWVYCLELDGEAADRYDIRVFFSQMLNLLNSECKINIATRQYCFSDLILSFSYS